MNRAKKIVTITTMLILVMSLSACRSRNNADTTDNNGTSGMENNVSTDNGYDNQNTQDEINQNDYNNNGNDNNTNSSTTNGEFDNNNVDTSKNDSDNDINTTNGTGLDENGSMNDSGTMNDGNGTGTGVDTTTEHGVGGVLEDIGNDLENDFGEDGTVDSDQPTR